MKVFGNCFLIVVFICGLMTWEEKKAEPSEIKNARIISR